MVFFLTCLIPSSLKICPIEYMGIVSGYCVCVCVAEVVVFGDVYMTPILLYSSQQEQMPQLKYSHWLSGPICHPTFGNLGRKQTQIKDKTVPVL